MGRNITSVRGFIQKVFERTVGPDERLFYRGHSKRSFTLQPSVFRNSGHADAEDKMFRELIMTNPTDFAHDETTLESLVRMQHFHLPTRLLDITSNPLTALFFACNEYPKSGAEVVVFTVKESDLKPYDSDTVCCIANLAKLSKAERAAINLELPVADFNATPEIQKLLYYIQMERPSFQAKIDPAYLRKIVCVKTKMSNERIVAQSGSFLLFGHGATLSAPSPIRVDGHLINATEKPNILQQLEHLNVHEGTMFPAIDHSATQIANQYRS